MNRRSQQGLLALALVTVVAVVANAQTTFQALFPGAAVDVSVGANNDAWVIGSDQGLWQLRDGGWFKETTINQAKRIAVSPTSQLWVMKADGSMMALIRGGDGVSIPGQAKDIAVGADGSVYHIGMAGALYKWNGSSWGAGFGSDAAQIAVDPQGNPWTVSPSGQISRYVNGVKQVLPGVARGIAIAANGAVLVIGSDAKTIWRWVNNGWKSEGSLDGALRLAVDPQGAPWVVNNQGVIYRGTPGK